jgi:hypothetical protein
MKHIFFFALMFFLLSSCDKSGKSNSVPAGPASSGAYSLEIYPAEARGDSLLRLIPHGFNISEAGVEWLKNGFVISNPDTHQLNLIEAEVKKGSALQAKAVFKGQEIFSDIVTVRNSPPMITGARILPEVFKTGDRFSVEVTGKDFDGDEVSFLYEWTLNGSPSGKNSSIDSQIKRGDKVTVKIIPFDGEDYGDPLVLDREIRNMPPEITEHNELNVSGNTFTYQVKASDPDGDQLSYALESPAPGMTINANSGLVSWTAPSDFKGKQSATVTASDGKGGVARYTFSIGVQ